MVVKILISFPLVPIQQWYGWIMYGTLMMTNQPSRNLFAVCVLGAQRMDSHPSSGCVLEDPD